ncbi:ABC transporter ATP-binding protein [Paenibacillus albiflavus]|uniref:ABC transporter ATP-binding protein n=1 Tax=Paenibacillus albiflavus TaxID=2545760 RepID=A0A4R4EH85_9BACL|nr:ABC transporter ATP-binding protein [Paenibacillus albiflavus]TCZ79474.1 ABC transporter ATP-binding protein [Paenibacillus albiflavus]
MSYIQIKDVVKRYHGKVSVDHLNLSIDQGEIFGLLGPNGAGKSTTIKLMTGLLPLDGGDITIHNQSVKHSSFQVKKRIGLVPQDLAIYESLSAKENVEFFGRLYGLRGQELQSRVKWALEFVGLSDKAKDQPKSFSGGMKRRLNIACSITHKPELIIMDEPTVGIDPQSRNHILESVKELNRMGSTIIYTSHYMEEVSAICTRVGIMDQGRLIACGTHGELREQVSHEERILLQVSGTSTQLIQAEQELKHYALIKKVIMTDSSIEIFMRTPGGDLQDILFILSKNQVAVHSLTRVEPDLEFLFLTLTGRKLRD